MSECRKSPEGKAGECCPRSTAAILACGVLLAAVAAVSGSLARGAAQPAAQIAWDRVGAWGGASDAASAQEVFSAGASAIEPVNSASATVRECPVWRSSPPSTLTPQELANHLLAGTGNESEDVNGDGALDVADVVRLLVIAP